MGIHEQLFAACPDIDRHAVLFWLGEYTGTTDYHRAMIAGPDRVDLNGAPVGAVTLSSVAYAKHRLKMTAAKDGDRQTHEPAIGDGCERTNPLIMQKVL
jgi:sRNA-binding protein